MKVVDGADARDALPRKAGANAVHERAAVGAEVVRHGVSRRHGTRLAEGFERRRPAQVLQVRVLNDEIRREHRRCELVAIAAVADEAAD